MIKTNSNYKKYIYSGIFLFVVGIITFYSSFNMYKGIAKGNEQNSKQAQQEEKIGESAETTIISSKTVKDVKESEKESEKETVRDEIREEKETNKKTTNDVETSKVEKKVVEEPVFIAPVLGNISKEFAKDSLVYSETLDEWVTHLAVDILAEKEEEVIASEKGMVTAVKEDPRYGLSITIEHESEYSSIYANLLASNVKEGDIVEKGQTIGFVGNTASFESSEKSHLHFEILKNNISVNPRDYISFEEKTEDVDGIVLD